MQLIDSLENASEGSVLPMLRSARLVLDHFALGGGGGGCKGSAVSSYHVDAIDVQVLPNFSSLFLLNKPTPPVLCLTLTDAIG